MQENLKTAKDHKKDKSGKKPKDDYN